MLKKMRHSELWLSKKWCWTMDRPELDWPAHLWHIVVLGDFQPVHATCRIEVHAARPATCPPGFS